MAHPKLTEDDERFVQVPADAVLMFAGASGTDTWIERERDVTVRLIAKSVAFATGDGATLEMCIDVKDGSARGQDGPAPADHHLRASQSVQVLVKAGERLAFKAYPKASNATVLRTVVCAADVKPVAAETAKDQQPPPTSPQSPPQGENQHA
jgi:hypothetical protein